MPEKLLSIGEALDLGVQCAMAGDHPSAVSIFKGVLVHEPENFEAIERVGSSLFEMQQYYEALYWFWRGRKINRRHALALTNYGLTLSQIGHCEEGLADLRMACFHADKSKDTAPGVKALVYNNLGNTLERLGRHAEALEVLDKGIAYHRGDPFPHYNRGICLLRLNRHHEAIEALNKSIELRPPALDSTSRLNDADARYNRGTANLLLGNLKDGFADYEARLTSSENKVPNLGLPPGRKWNGTDSIDGKRLLVHCEQGLGDTIQFLRFLPLLGECGADVRVIVHSALRPMVEAMGEVTVLEPKENPDQHYDMWVALMSLPFMLGFEDEASLPPPWIPPIERERFDKWQINLNLPRTLSVGVCWAGNFSHKNNAHRSIPLEKFARIFDAKGVTFVSLQQMQQADTEAWPAIRAKHPNISALWLDDFRDTAAVILNLDLVISADTALAHMAATLGIPTWILIPKFGTDWRWMIEREDTPWYPSATLYRQNKIGDWQSVLDRIRNELAKLADVAEQLAA